MEVPLKDITEKGYIHRDYSRKTVTASQQPAIYYLAPQARHILKKDNTCDLSVLSRIYKEKKRTKKFITHCIALADWYLFFYKQKKEGENLRFFTESMLTKYAYFPHPLPSAYIARKTPDGVKRYFLELFDPYTPASVLRFHVRRYLEYSESGEWELHAREEKFPAILFVCPSDRIKKHIYYYTRALFEKAFEEKINLFLTTHDALQKGKGLWEKVC